MGLIESKKATEILKKLVPIWEKRKEMHKDGGRTPRILLHLEIEFFLGAVAALDIINKEEKDDIKYTCLPPAVWTSVVRNESIADALKK